MQIVIDVERASTEVRDQDDLKRFSVVVPAGAGAAGLDPVAVDEALVGLGRLDSGTHAWIDIAALRAASGREHDGQWGKDFEAMVAYAASNGWVDAEGKALRAHLEVRASD